MAKKGRLVVCEFAIKFTDVGLLECCDENNALYRHSAWSPSMIKATTSLLDGSRGKSLKCHNYFRKSIELQTFNKFAVNIVSINFLGLNIPKIIMWKIHIWKNPFVNITLNRRKLNDCSAGYSRLAECEIKTRGSSERKLKIENWNKGKHLCICLTRIIKNAKAQIMHRKYLICCTTLYKYLEKISVIIVITLVIIRM